MNKCLKRKIQKTPSLEPKKGTPASVFMIFIVSTVRAVVNEFKNVPQMCVRVRSFLSFMSLIPIPVSGSIAARCTIRQKSLEYYLYSMRVYSLFVQLQQALMRIRGLFTATNSSRFMRGCNPYTKYLIDRPLHRCRPN